MNDMAGTLPTDAQPIYDLVKQVLPVDVFGRIEVQISFSGRENGIYDWIFFYNYESVIGYPFYSKTWEQKINRALRKGLPCWL